MQLGDELQLKETKLFLNYLILYDVKVDKGAKPNIQLTLLLLTTSEAVVHFLTGTSGSTTTCFLFLFLILSIRKTKKSGIKIIEVIMDVTSLYNLITFLSYRVNMIYELWLHFRIKMLFALKNSRNIMEV